MSGGTTSTTIIVGNVGADPELKYMPSGGGVLNLSVATTVAWKDTKTGDKKSETEWHRCVLFNGQAENAAKYLKSGSKVSITGRNRTRKWTDNDGLDRYVTEIYVRDIQYLDRVSDPKDSSSTVNNASEAMNQLPSDPPLDNFDDDIPH